jgi:hypothetical protein
MYQDALPIITLMLGAAIGWLVKRSESRRTEQVEAGNALAELPNFIWKQGADDSWTRLQVFLGRLRIRLRAAGVPDAVIEAINRAAIAHWRDVEELDDMPGFAVDTAVATRLEGAIDDAQEWLFGPTNPLKRRSVRSRRAREIDDG